MAHAELSALFAFTIVILPSNANHFPELKLCIMVVKHFIFDLKCNVISDPGANKLPSKGFRKERKKRTRLDGGWSEFRQRLRQRGNGPAPRLLVGTCVQHTAAWRAPHSPQGKVASASLKPRISSLPHPGKLYASVGIEFS